MRNDKRDPDRYEQLANEVEEYLINNYNKNITSDVLSKEFGFVPSYISRLFKRQKGVSPNEYVTKYRIEKAKKLIEENNDLRIKILPTQSDLKNHTISQKHSNVKPVCGRPNIRQEINKLY